MRIHTSRIAPDFLNLNRVYEEPPRLVESETSWSKKSLSQNERYNPPVLVDIDVAHDIDECGLAAPRRCSLSVDVSTLNAVEPVEPLRSLRVRVSSQFHIYMEERRLKCPPAAVKADIGFRAICYTSNRRGRCAEGRYDSGPLSLRRRWYR